ncbi:zinc-dependent alcohol dehydrogenase family protein [Crocosphaera watsonii]|nr:zinc-dependent alcohol dehydrogenase family protein [Crocosphaera watsonii]
MKAQVIHEFGPPNVFETSDIPKPKPEDIPANHVLIRVAATSVNPVDSKIRSGMVPGIAPALPAILHGDVAGVVEAVGEGVTKFQPGDQVFGCAGGVKGLNGALAEYMVADADLLALKPQSISMTQAAALPLVGITSYEAFIDRAQIRSGQRVLIHAATGGVGHIAIQLAKAKGAKVFATASNPQKLAIAQELGADVAINYRETTVSEYVDQYTNGQGFDVVFDTVGGHNLDKSFEAAALNGTVVSISTRSTHDLSLLHSKGLTLHVVFMLIPLLHNIHRAKYGEILSKLAQLVDQGKIRPLIDPQSFTFSEVAQAHQHLESGQAIGKIVLTQETF